MRTGTRTTIRFVLLALLLAVTFLLNLSLGSVEIPFSETIGALAGENPGHGNTAYIVRNYRLPKAITAVLCGGGLALCGLLMQTLFRNPLAGPFVLGISSGASLGAALLILGASLFGPAVASLAFSNVALALASSAGSLLVLLIVLVVARRLRDAMALLIVGLMFGSITAAIVTVLSSFARAEELQQYIFWSYGSMGSLSWSQVGLLSFLFFAAVFLSVRLLKGLNALLLGESYAESLGIPIRSTRLQILLVTGILAGAITAFAGPIAFVGLAVPHLSRLLLGTSDHRRLVPGVLLYGALLMLVCDIVAQLPASSYVLPINAVTSVVGAPVVIWLLLSKKNMVF